MRVLVAGATGAIGRPLVSQLLACGHQVTGLTRSEERAQTLRSRGAEAIVGDVFERDRLRDAVVHARPEAVIDQLTDLPAVYDPRRYEEMTVPTNRLRSEGTPSLVAAAEAAGAHRYLAQSLAFVYAPEGDWVKDEDAPLVSGAPPAIQKGVDAVRRLEDAVLGATGLEGIVLRYGQFYGPGTWFAASGSLADQVRKRRFPIIGRGEGHFSFVHVEDAAGATVAALDHGRPGVYNVCDDEPAPMREWLPVYAEAVGARRPLRVPVWLVRLVGGPAGAQAAHMRGASNAKAREELGWIPRYPSWREGFKVGLG